MHTAALEAPTLVNGTQGSGYSSAFEYAAPPLLYKSTYMRPVAVVARVDECENTSRV